MQKPRHVDSEWRNKSLTCSSAPVAQAQFDMVACVACFCRQRVLLNLPLLSPLFFLSRSTMRPHLRNNLLSVRGDGLCSDSDMLVSPLLPFSGKLCYTGFSVCFRLVDLYSLLCFHMRHPLSFLAESCARLSLIICLLTLPLDWSLVDYKCLGCI